MRDYSTTSRRGINATSGEAPLLLLEISHADLAEPIRVVSDTVNCTHQGNTFAAFGFDIDLPDDQDRQAPRAQVGVDNVGRDLTTWIEQSNGGEGAMCRILHVQRADPDVIDWETTVALSNVEMDIRRIIGTLGYEDLLGKPGIVLTYRPDTAPGIF